MFRSIRYGIGTFDRVETRKQQQIHQLIDQYANLYHWTNEPPWISVQLQAVVNIDENELNARALIGMMLEASKILTDREWYLVDEGPALYCPLLVRNGLAKPNAHAIWQRLSAVSNYSSAAKHYYRYQLQQHPEYTSINAYLRPFRWEVNLPTNEPVSISEVLKHFIGVEVEGYDAYYFDIDEYPLTETLTLRNPQEEPLCLDNDTSPA